MNNYDVEGARGLLEFQGRTIISINNGQRLGAVDDILIDPASGEPRLHGLVTAKSGFLRPEVNAFLAEEVFLWGQDVILVKNNEAIVKRDSLPGIDECMSSYHSIPGRDVISLGGDRLGEMRDLLVTPQGALAGFTVDRLRGELAELLGDQRGVHRLPVSVIQSFGRDVMILDLKKLREMVPPGQVNVEEGG